MDETVQTEGQPNTNPEVQSPAPAPAATTERPAWLPEKFASPEAMATAYTELEKKLGGGTTKPADPAPAPAQTTQAPASNEPISEDAFRANLTTAGVSFDELENEFIDNGKLTDASYDKLARAGFPRSFVDAYVAGQAALSEQQQQHLFQEIGGAAEWDKVQAWAKGNLSAREKQQFNEATQRGGLELMGLAVRGLHAKYVASVGREPQLLSGESNGPTLDGYASAAEAKAAMRDPRYRNDPAYRQSVEDKLGKSNVFRANVVTR